MCSPIYNNKMLAQAARSWVASPLGVNLLLSLFRDINGNLQHLEQIQQQLEKNQECTTKTNVFVKPEYNRELLKYVQCVEQFERPYEALSSWVKENTEFRNTNLRNNIPETTKLILVNISTFESTWITPTENAGTPMKIYNSFSYTQDVKYESRILELPMQNKDFKFVVIVPNETDILHTLFRRLVNKGLRVALSNLQPIFTVTSKLIAPCIKFTSEGQFQMKINKMDNVVVHNGNIDVNELGTRIQVLSCLYPTMSATKSTKQDLSKMDPPFFFGLMFKDTPIFVGQFNPKQ